MQPFRKDVSSYFDYLPKPHGSSEATSPASVESSPGPAWKRDQRTIHRLPYFRSKSDYDEKHKRIHVPTIDEDRDTETSSTYGSTTSSSHKRALSKAGKVDGNRTDLPPDQIALPASGKSSPGLRLHSIKQAQTNVSSRWSGWRESRHSSSEMARRASLADTVPSTPTSGVLLVRTDLTPLRPPPSKSVAAPENSNLNPITVETEFQQRSHATPKESPDTATCPGPSSRRSSFNPKHIFSLPLTLIRRASLPKSDTKHSSARPCESSPVSKDVRLADHMSGLKRNYTTDVLERVSSILQEIKVSSQTSIWPPQGIKPLKWRTMSDKSVTPGEKKAPRTTQGISQFANAHRGSGELVSDIPSYTSSQRNLRMGDQPTSTPDERATYKVKRSPSAETEEFLKVDISIRGGTSYLASEARRIHTPPLPEEGLDGRWRGFFFDYNAPRRTSSLRDSEGEHEWCSGTITPASTEEGRSRSTTVSKKLDRNKSKNNKNILAGDWYDVKLAELDMGGAADQVEKIQAKEGEKRVNSPEVLSKIGRERDMPQFDWTIPEHLPSCPLCPRHPRYWRVVKNKGSQFRGC